jgi:2'-5' RNA ligase
VARATAPRPLTESARQRDQSAVIVRVALPPALDRLRRRSVEDADDGMPAHVTLLYPFVAPARLDAAVRATIATVARRHAAFDFTLGGPERWPDTIYASVEPAAPFLAIHRELTRAFPEYPIYGRPAPFELVPHVTVAEGAVVDEPARMTDPSWSKLPALRRAAALEVIASDAQGRWRLVWRLRLGLQSADAADVPPV